jgi:glucose-1-phosphate thymidylyltransferase
MNIIVPMAGRGSRLRPHTLTVPKPLIPVAGKPIVERLVEDIVARSGEPVEEIAFVIGDFGAEAEAQLLAVAERLGAKGRICYQREPLGTAHAILCGRECLNGPVVVAFADTLFRADFTIDPSADGVLFVQRIEDPSAFGVVVTDEEGAIVDYVEKPTEWVGDLAMIGIYAFKDGERLERELQRLIDEDVRHGGEYQLPDALRNMTNAGLRFLPGEVSEWMDCGNKAVTVETNRRVLDLTESHVDPTAVTTDSVILPPVFIGAGARIERSVIGPHVSIGAGTVVADSRIDNALIQDHSTLENARLSGAMIGSHAHVDGGVRDVSLGDYSTIQG